MIWIIGEYAKNIADADALLEGFLANFLDESVQVQLQLLTATVKLFLHKPTTNGLLLNVLQQATKVCRNPDVRDRAFIYERLLSNGSKAAEVLYPSSLHSPTFLLNSSFIFPFRTLLFLFVVLLKRFVGGGILASCVAGKSAS